jgi:hypothetical protein
VATLIAAGHRVSDIRTYTLRQLHGFVELAALHDKAKLESYGSMTRAAVNADKKQWAKILKEFDNG